MSKFCAGNVVRFAAPSGTAARDGWPVSGATDAHLAAINALPGVLKPLTAADVFVRECDAINSLRLKNGLRIDRDAELAAIATLCVGKGIHLNHDTWTGEGLPQGRIFAASFTSGSPSVVRQWFYIVADEETAKLVNKIDCGAISEVSVSFGHDELLCSICNTDLSKCAHWPMDVYDGKTCEGLVRGVTEYFETSLVWQGMANDTAIRMAASADADLAALFADKPRRPCSDIAELFVTPPELVRLFATNSLSTLFGPPGT